MALTPKQQRFVDAYTGNGVAAARAAGYAGNAEVLAAVAHENLRKPQIARAIEESQRKAAAPLIADRQERQAFWSDIMRNREANLLGRLKASELLGKSEVDFTDKVEHSGAVSIAVVDPYAEGK